MPYVELKKLHYIDSEKYAKEYLNRFASEEAVKLDFYIKEKQAFFLLNADVMSLAYKIARIDKRIGKLCDNLPGIAINQYSKKCLIDEIVITNKIEGVHSSRKEIGDALDILEKQSSSKGKHARFLSLVNKYLKLSKQNEIPLSQCQDIRDIYDEILFKEVVSEDRSNKPDGEIFRRESVSVYSATNKEIHCGMTPESKIIESMQKALDFLNDDSTEMLFRICIFHYLFEYIHPFYDGNGRMGRFILSYGITKTLEPLVAFRISETIAKNKTAYYKAFETCNDQRNLGDLTPFLLMQLKILLEAMEDLEKSLYEKMCTWEKYEEAVESFCDNEQVLRIIYSCLVQAALFSENGISMQELQNAISLSSYLVKKNMNKIPSEMIIEKRKGRLKYYSINLEKLNSVILDNSIETLKNKG